MASSAPLCAHGLFHKVVRVGTNIDLFFLAQDSSAEPGTAPGPAVCGCTVTICGLRSSCDGEYLAAVGGRGWAEHSVVVEAYVYGVGREARIQRHHDPGGQDLPAASPLKRMTIDGRPSLSQLCKRCLIWPRAVLPKRGIFGQNDLVRAAVVPPEPVRERRCPAARLLSSSADGLELCRLASSSKTVGAACRCPARQTPICPCSLPCHSLASSDKVPVPERLHQALAMSEGLPDRYVVSALSFSAQTPLCAGRRARDTGP